jgi:hypothetical protein
LLDNDTGYLKNSEINLARASFRYYLTDHLFRLHEFEIVEATSFNPVTTFDHGLSWTIQIGTFSPGDLECHQCTAGRVTGGIGYSVAPVVGSENVLLYALLKPTVEYSGWFDHAFRYGPSVEVGALSKLFDAVKVHVSGAGFYFPSQSSDENRFVSATGEASYLLKTNFESRAGTTQYFTPTSRRADYWGALSYYF